MHNVQFPQHIVANFGKHHSEPPPCLNRVHPKPSPMSPSLLTIIRITKHFGDEWKNFHNLTLCALALLPTAFQPTAMFIKCQCKGNSLLKNNCTNNANCVDQQFWKILNNKTKVPKRANGLLQSIVLSDLNVWMPDGWKCFASFCTPAHNITYITLSVKDNRYYLIMEMDIGIYFEIPAK